MSTADGTGLKRLAGRLRGAVTLLVAGIASLLALSQGVGIVHGYFPGRWDGWIAAALPAIYLWGLIRLRSGIGAVAAGELFGPAVERALRDLGAALLVGQVMELVVLPNLRFWLLGPGHGSLLMFDPGGFAAGAMGAGLVLVSRLFRTAAAMRDELGGFV